MANPVTLVKEVYKKTGGVLSDPYKIGTSFQEVVDVTPTPGDPNSTATGYTLKQFFDNYLDFMNSANFIEYGAGEPTNPHVKIWIDTAHTNQG